MASVLEVNAFLENGGDVGSGPVKRPIDFLANRLDFFTNIESYTSRLNIGQLSLCT